MTHFDDTLPTRASWTPISGCFPCPVNIDNSPVSASTIDPLPMFQHLGRGYHSVPLGTFYLPSDLVSRIDPSLVLISIDPHRVGDLLGTWFHEQSHFDFPTTAKMQIQLAAFEAWESLGALLDGDLNPLHWDYIQKCNEIINALSQHAALVEELFTTFDGIRRMRKYVHADIVDEVEERFVHNHNALFPGFSAVYEDLLHIHSHSGLEPIALLGTFSQDLIQIDHENPVGMWLPLMDLNNSMSAGRFKQGITALKALIAAEVSTDSWSREKWMQFFSGCLYEFSKWLATREEVYHILENNEQVSESVWYKEFNPVSGLHGVYSGMKHLGLIPTNRPQQENVDIAEKIGGDESKGHVLKLKNAIEKYEHYGGIERDFFSIVFGSGESLMDDTMYFVRGMTGIRGEHLAVPCIALGDGNSEEERRSRSNNINALLFYESCRGQIAKRKGIRCPLFGAEISPATGLPMCCGMVEMFRQVYKVGVWARDNLGYKFETWEPFTECGV